jgi:hypothetical protein
MELREYWNVARKRGWIIVLVAIVAAVAALGVSLIIPKTYRASIQLSVEPARADWGLSQAAKELLANYVVNIRSHTNVQDAIDRGQLDMTTDQFLADLDVSYDASNLTITIQARQPRRRHGHDHGPATGRRVCRKAKRSGTTSRKRAPASMWKRWTTCATPSCTRPSGSSTCWPGQSLGPLPAASSSFSWSGSRQTSCVRPATWKRASACRPGRHPGPGRVLGPGRRKWGLPAWIEPGVLLVFVTGLAIGAGLGALVVGLL